MTPARAIAVFCLVMAFSFPAAAGGGNEGGSIIPLAPMDTGLCLAEPRHPVCEGGSFPAALPSQELLSYLAEKDPWIASRFLRLVLEAILMGALACLLDSPFAAVLLLAVLVAAWLAPASVHSWPAFLYLRQSQFVGGLFGPLKEQYYLLFVALAVALLVWRSKKPTPLRSLLSALAVGSSLLYRSALFFLPPLLAAFDGFLLKKALPAKSRRISSLIMALVPYVMILPWVRMNWVVHHQFIPVEVGEGNGNIATGALGIVHAMVGNLWSLTPGLHEGMGTWEMLAWAAGEVLRHPLRYLISYALRLEFVFSLWPFLFAFVLMTLWLYRKEREFQYFGIVIGYFVAIHCMMSVWFEYFIPLAPLFVSAAAAGASRMLRELPRSRAVKLLRLKEALRAQRKAPAKVWGWSATEMGDAASGAAVLGCLGLALLLSGYSWGKMESYIRWHAPASGRTELTIEALDLAIRRHPGDPWLRSLRGARELRGKHWRPAVRDYSAALAAQPGNRPWRLSWEWALARLGRPEELLRHGITSDSGVGHLLAAAEYLREGKRASADRELEGATCLGHYCESCGIADAGPEAHAEDKWAVDRLRADCQHDIAYFWGKAFEEFAPVLDTIGPRERDALESEYAKLKSKRKNESADPAPEGGSGA